MKFAKLGKFKKYIMMICNYFINYIFPIKEDSKKVVDFEIIIKKKFDSKTAIKLYEKAYNIKNSIITYYDKIIISAEPNINLDELFLYFGKKSETASVCFDKIIRSNYMYLLGYDYFYGNEITKNYNESLKWIKKAALLGNIYAIYTIENIFNDKSYAEICYEKNIDYFEKNWINMKETISNKDYEILIRYYNKNNTSYKLNQFGLYYLNDKIIKVNYRKAIKYFKKAIKMKYTQAMNNLANCYFNGYGANLSRQIF